MGDEADDVLTSFGLSEEDRKKYDVVKAKFENHFVKKRNIIFERAKFNQRKQEEGESVDTFITSLYCLAEHCNYGALHDDMIRDRIVVGLRDAQLSEKLQLNAELTLEKAMTIACQSEAVKQSCELREKSPRTSMHSMDDEPTVEDQVQAMTPQDRVLGNAHDVDVHIP